jgi:hypothetical protein
MALKDTNDFFSHSNRYKLPKLGFKWPEGWLKVPKVDINGLNEV